MVSWLVGWFGCFNSFGRHSVIKNVPPFRCAIVMHRFGERREGGTFLDPPRNNAIAAAAVAVAAACA